MTELKTLFLMQVKEKINVSFLKSKKQTLFKVVFSIAEFVGVTALAYLIFWICRYLNLFSPLSYLPVSVLAVVFLVMFVFSIISCTISLSKSLFYDLDNAVLGTYPVSPIKIFLSKIMVYYINELNRTIFFLIPIFYAYVILSGVPAIAYIWIPVMLVIFTAFEVLLSAFFAIPIYYLLRFFNRVPVLKYILMSVLVAGVVAVVVFLINCIPEDINLIKSWVKISTYLRQFLSWFTDKFFVFYAFSIFLCGRYSNFKIKFFTMYSWSVFLVMLAGIVLLLLIDILIYRFAYTKITISQFEYNKKHIKKQKENVAHSSFVSACLYEAKRCVRYQGVLMSTMVALIITPVTILLLNSIYAAISTRLIGKYMVIAFNVLIVLLFTTSSNVWVASIYSRDGEAFTINKTKPHKPFAILFPRLFLSLLKTVVVVVVSSAIFLQMSSINLTNSILIILMEILVSFGHILWSAEIDFLNPKPNIFKTSGTAGINPNELKSMIMSFLLSLIAMGIVIFFLLDAATYVYFRILIFAIVFFVYRLFMFCFKARMLFTEGEA